MFLRTRAASRTSFNACVLRRTQSNGRRTYIANYNGSRLFADYTVYGETFAMKIGFTGPEFTSVSSFVECVCISHAQSVPALSLALVHMYDAHAESLPAKTNILYS